MNIVVQEKLRCLVLLETKVIEVRFSEHRKGFNWSRVVRTKMGVQKEKSYWNTIKESTGVCLLETKKFQEKQGSCDTRGYTKSRILDRR